MTKEQLFLLDVLKGFIHEEKLNFDIELDWAKVVQLSTIHTVTGILGYMAMKNPCERTLPILNGLKKQCFANIAVFTQRTERAKQIIAKLDQAGIDHMLFKGHVVRNYYPVPELRSYGDIDILIKREDRVKCHELMLEQGFEVKTDWEPVFSYYKGMELYEIHTEVMEVNISDNVDSRSYFNTAWEYALNVGGHEFEPTPEFHFIYLLAHIAKHIRGEGAGIRMYMDLAVFIKHFGNDVKWNYVSGKLDELKLKQFANVALMLVESLFGIPSPIELQKIDDEIFEDFMDYTMDGGVFGQIGRDSGLITLKKNKNKSRIAVILHRLLPTAESIESRYTYLHGRHWLLPVAWVHRFFKTSDSWGAHAAEAKSIMKTDDSEVEKLKRIYKEIGL